MSSLPVAAMPLTEEQTTHLHSAVTGLSAEQLQWVSGYMAGLAAAGAPAIAAPLTAQQSDERLTILFGSQTGNGEAIARALQNTAETEGFATRLQSLADFKPSALKREQLVVFVVSTHGEGDPPDDAELFHEYLLSDSAPSLNDLQYAVLALGDSSYVNFCQTGRDFDARLADLGARRVLDIVECDLDYADAAGDWSRQIAAKLPKLLKAESMPAVPHLRAVATAPAYHRQSPFAAEVLVNQKITGGDSRKDVRHIELSIEGSGLAYEPGDALAVIAENPPQLVDDLMALLGLEPSDPVTVGEESSELALALQRHFEITSLHLAFLRDWVVLSGSNALTALLDDSARDALGDFIERRQIIDVVREFPVSGIGAQQFVDMLRKLNPRSYSLASSLAANPDEAHLTVAVVRYEAYGQQHWGAASTHLADRLNVGDRVSVYVEPNSRFRLPAPDVPIIMIGPGTGVAPFRAFVEERAEQGAAGDNWLIFGDRHFGSDFLYQLEWQRHLKQGNLTKLDVAFSRDQRRKVYVQDRIRENGAEVWRWLERGAVVYVCGDAKRMAGDVHDALIEVIAEHGSLDIESADKHLKELRAAGRYKRDVY